MNENMNNNMNENVATNEPTQVQSFEQKAKNFGQTIMNTAESSETYTPEEITNGKTMGILSYIIPFVPYFTEKNNRYVQYHAKQGMNLLVLAIAYSIVYAILSALIKVKDCGDGWVGELAEYYGTCAKVTPWWVTIPLSIIGFGITILCIIGIVNVVNGKAKELPVVNKIKIFK